MYLIIYLRQQRKYTFSPACPCSFVCLSVCLSVCVQDYSKTRAWIWMKCCVSTDVGTWTNLLTFEPGPDHSLDAGTGFLEPFNFLQYALQRGNIKFYYVGKIPCTYWYWGPSKQQRVVLRRRNTVVGGKCALPSALLVNSALREFHYVPDNHESFVHDAAANKEKKCH